MNKQVNLINDITKNIINQYILQLESSIRKNTLDVSLGMTERINRIDKAQEALNHVKKIYNSYDKAFEKYIENMVSSSGIPEDTNSLKNAVEFSKRLLTTIGVNPDAIIRSLYHFIIKETNSENYNLEDYSISYQESLRSDVYKEDGIYPAGQLKFNKYLNGYIDPNSGEYINFDYEHPIYEEQGLNFNIDANQIDEIGKKYLESLATERKLNNDDFLDACRIMMSIMPGKLILFPDSFNLYMYNFVTKYNFKGLKKILEGNNSILEKYSKQSSNENVSVNELVNNLKSQIEALKKISNENKELNNIIAELEKTLVKLEEDNNGFKR